jgi:hypothetical protein
MRTHHRMNHGTPMHRYHDEVRRLGKALKGVGMAFGVALAVSACDVSNLLDVEAPDRIPAAGLATPQNAELLTNGAIGDFECAYGAYVGLSSVMAGEMTDATQTAARWPYDRRNVQSNESLYSSFGCEGLGIYTPISRARWSADNILTHLEGWTDAEVDDRQSLIAAAAAFSGYSHVLLGEGFCSAAIDLSTELSPDSVLKIAVTRFTTAIAAAQASGETDLLNLAYVGRARAYLDLGQTANAVADAQRVPPDFEYEVSASTASSRRYNRVFAQNGEGSTGGTALSVGTAYRNVTYNGVPDPRVPVVDAGVDNSDGTPRFFQKKYNSLSTPLPLATGDEAQLIIAEIEGGQTAVGIINDFHERAGLPPFVSVDEAEIRAHVIEERRRELWLEGHRFNDIERFDLPLSPAEGTVHRKGGTYGGDRCFPLPDVERRNNPNID